MQPRIPFVLLVIVLLPLYGCRRTPTGNTGAAGTPVPPQSIPQARVDPDELIDFEFAGDANFDLQLGPEPHPIPTGPDQKTAADFRGAWREYRERDLAHYIAASEDQGEVRAAGEEFLKAYIARQVRDPQRVSVERVKQLGDRVVELGSQDPAILVCHAIVQLDLTHAQGHRTLIDAAPRLADAGYSSLLQMLAALRLLTVANVQREGIDASSREARRQCVKWLAEEGGQPETVRIVWRYLSALMGVFSSGQQVFHRMEDEKRLLDACLALPQLDPWLRNMLAGKYYRDLASHYRGSATVNWVTPEGALKHAQFVPIAGKFFKRAWQLRPDLPEAAAAMISVALTSETQISARGWFDRGVRAELDNGAVYGSYYITLLPRWGGNNQSIIDFAQECAATERYDTMVPHYYTELLTKVRYAMDGDTQIWQRPGLYEQLQAVFDGYEQDGTIGPFRLREMRASRASIAVDQGDFATARVAYDLLDEAADADLAAEETAESPWASRDFDREYALTYAMTGPAKEIVEQFQFTPGSKVFLDREEVVQQQALVAEARQLDEHPATVELLDELDKLLDWRAAFVAGEWVNLTFDKRMLGWDPRHGEYQVEDENTVLVSTLNRGGGLRLKNLLPFEPPFVVQADVEEPDPDVIPHVGIFVGQIESFDSTGRFFWVDRSTAQTGYTLYNTQPMSAQRRLLPRNRLSVKIWPGRFELVTNQMGMVFPEGAMDRFYSDGSLAFGEHMYVGLHGTVRFSRLRIRALDHGPPPPATDTEASAKYHAAAIAFDPEDGPALKLLAVHQLSSDRLAEARGTLEQLQNVLDKSYWAESGLHYLFGVLDETEGRYRQALAHYQAAYPLAQYTKHVARRMAWIHATCPEAELRDGRAALEYAQTASTPGDEQDGSYQTILAAALAESGQFPQAVQAQRLAIAQAAPEELAELEAQLKLYLANIPYREPAPSTPQPEKSNE